MFQLQFLEEEETQGLAVHSTIGWWFRRSLPRSRTTDFYVLVYLPHLQLLAQLSQRGHTQNVCAWVCLCVCVCVGGCGCGCVGLSASSHVCLTVFSVFVRVRVRQSVPASAADPVPVPTTVSLRTSLPVPPSLCLVDH